MAAARSKKRKTTKKRPASGAAKPKSTKSAPAKKPRTPASRTVEPGTTWGRVDGYLLDDAGLTIKLNSSAISRRLVFVGVDRPMFKAAVSLVMMAHNSRFAGDSEVVDLEAEYLSVKYRPEQTAGDHPLQAVALASGRDAFGKLEDYTVLPPTSTS